ncbi:MAG: hypothetical protein ACK5N4_23500 [Parabacteroides gordonii]|uniref:hypothetical protein n=1 Tax=Parabacteroides gordonii TaxID=574930 RepID=UPI003A89E190
MPHEWNNMIVVTKEELIPDFFPSEKALLQKLWRETKRPYGIRRARQGKGLGNDVLINFDTLPKEWRDILGDPRRVDCILDKFFWEDSEAVTYFSGVTPGKRGGLEVERQREYVLDASVLMAAIRLRSAHYSECVSRGRPVKNTDKYISDAVNAFNEFRRIKKLPEHNLPTNHISLKRKIEKFENEGYSSLLSRYDNNNASRKTEKIMNLLNAMYIHKEKPTQIEVFRLYDGFLNGYVKVINPETGEVYNPKEYGKLSARTVTAFLASWKEKVATHMKRAADRQQYLSKFDVWTSLEQPEYAGSIISIDDRQPPFEYAKGQRLWFYNAIDLGSECIIAFVYGKEKDRWLMEQFYKELARCMTEWGKYMPYEIECESNLNATFKDTLLREGAMFSRVRILANSARSKRIERYFGNLRYEYEKKRSGWIGRPFALNEAYQRNGEKPEYIPYDTLVRNCIEDIIEWNNSPHSKHPDKTRWEVFCEKQHPDLKPTNWRGFLPELGEHTQTSCKVGHIRLNNQWFLLGDNDKIFTGQPLLDTLSLIEGKDVNVYWLRGHHGQVLKALVYMNGRCICEALPKPIAKRSSLEAKGDIQAAEAMEIVQRYANTVRGWAKQHKNEMEKLLIVDNRKRTLNNGFNITWIDGISTPVYNDEPETREAEVLEEVELKEFNDVLNNVETGYKRPSMADRF